MQNCGGTGGQAVGGEGGCHEKKIGVSEPESC